VNISASSDSISKIFVRKDRVRSHLSNEYKIISLAYVDAEILAIL